MSKTKWGSRKQMLCTRPGCGKPLTLPYAHIHFHYGHEGLSEKLTKELEGLVGPGYDAQPMNLGLLGGDICFDCFLELIDLLIKWREVKQDGKKEGDGR